VLTATISKAKSEKTKRFIWFFLRFETVILPEQPWPAKGS